VAGRGEDGVRNEERKVGGHKRRDGRERRGGTCSIASRGICAPDDRTDDKTY